MNCEKLVIFILIHYYKSCREENNLIFFVKLKKKTYLFRVFLNAVICITLNRIVFANYIRTNN